MANVFTNQPTPSGNSTTLATSYVFGSSWTPPNGEVLLAIVSCSQAAGDITPTMSGNSLTWTNIGSIGWSTTATPTRRTTLFRALVTGASAGQITVDFGITNQTGCSLIVVSVAGCKTTGTNAADAIVQSVANFADTANTTAAVTLAAFGASGNSTYMGVGINGVVTAITADTNPAGYTLSTQQSYTSPAVDSMAEWNVANDTAPTMTWTTNGRWGAVAAEIAVAVAGGQPAQVPQIMIFG